MSSSSLFVVLLLSTLMCSVMSVTTQKKDVKSYYFSSNGSDMQSGTSPDQPWRTLQKAATVSRRMILLWTQLFVILSFVVYCCDQIIVYVCDCCFDFFFFLGCV